MQKLPQSRPLWSPLPCQDQNQISQATRTRKRGKNPERVRKGRERTLLALAKQLEAPGLTERQYYWIQNQRARIVRRLYKAYEKSFAAPSPSSQVIWPDRIDPLWN
jgi:hypothetical protein